MLDIFALILLIFVVLVLFYGVIVIHDIPYEIAKRRDHPHQDAIHIAGWVSLFTLHVLWPFLWIWASLYKADRGWGFVQPEQSPALALVELEQALVDLQQRVAELESAQRSADNEAG